MGGWMGYVGDMYLGVGDVYIFWITRSIARALRTPSRLPTLACTPAACVDGARNILRPAGTGPPAQPPRSAGGPVWGHVIPKYTFFRPSPKSGSSLRNWALNYGEKKMHGPPPY